VHPLNEPTTAAATSDEIQADDWSLVLASQGIAHQLVRGDGVFTLLVEPADVARARAALVAYVRENPRREAAAPAAPPGRYAGSMLGVALGVLLLAFHALVVRGPLATQAWYERGGGVAERILHGEPWRAVTALTLHGDAGHVAANAVACALFVTALARIVGPGLAALLVLLAGAGGNALNALLHQAHHDSIGASTAIFGAVGLLGGVEFLRRRRMAARRLPAWMPIAAGLALLGMLGTAKETDVFAHLFGFLSGVVLGAGAAAPLPQPPRPAAQWLLGACAATALACSWLLAFR
jgi:membrane associated rhomboid family serine protease